MIRARFKVSEDACRSINWPLKHPYWYTGYGDGHSIVVAYADDIEEISCNWPEAEDIEYEEVDGYNFSDRFPIPDWFNGRLK